MPESTKKSKADACLDGIRSNVQKYIAESIKDPNANFETIKALVGFLANFDHISDPSPSAESSPDFADSEYFGTPPIVQGLSGAHFPGAGHASLNQAFLNKVKKPVNDMFMQYLPKLMEAQRDSVNPPEKRAMNLFNVADILEKRGKKDLAERCRIMASEMMDDMTLKPSTNSEARPIELSED